MAFTQPTTRKAWQRLREDLEKASPTDFPAVDAAKFEEFKAGILELTDGAAAMRSTVIGLIPILLLILSEHILRLFRPGAILWLAATIWIIAINVRAGIRRKRLQESTFSLGRTIGMVV